MLKLFSPTDKNFFSNGDKIITPTKAKIHKEDNGSFYLDLECGLEYINYIIQNNIIVAPTPQGEQTFMYIVKCNMKFHTRIILLKNNF